MTKSFSQCWDFVRTGACPRGDECKWDHTSGEEPVSSYSTNPLDPNQFCWNYMRTGRCPRGNRCSWIHDLIMVPGSYMGAGPAYPPVHKKPVTTSIAPISTALEDSVDWSLELPSTPDAYWDQFSENRRLFGTMSTFDPSLSCYTSPLPIEGLTSDQIRKAEELSRIPLPSEKLQSQNIHSCVYCGCEFENMDKLSTHIRQFLTHSGRSGEEENGDVCFKGVSALLKRKSWIVTQETLPNGLVSQIEGLYTRPVTSSTNLQMITDCVLKSPDVDDETRSYLVNELLSIIILGITQKGLQDKEKEQKLNKPAAKIQANETISLIHT